VLWFLGIAMVASLQEAFAVELLVETYLSVFANLWAQTPPRRAEE